MTMNTRIEMIGKCEKSTVFAWNVSTPTIVDDDRVFDRTENNSQKSKSIVMNDIAYLDVYSHARNSFDFQ